MDLLMSILLLAAFVVAVEVMAGSSVGEGIAGLFGLMFETPDRLAWPIGVQEDDDHRLLSLVAGRASYIANAAGRAPYSAIGAPVASGGCHDWPAVELVEGSIRPVPVEKIRRRR